MGAGPPEVLAGDGGLLVKMADPEGDEFEEQRYGTALPLEVWRTASRTGAYDRLMIRHAEHGMVACAPVEVGHAGIGRRAIRWADRR